MYSRNHTPTPGQSDTYMTDAHGNLVPRVHDPSQNLPFDVVGDVAYPRFPTSFNNQPAAQSPSAPPLPTQAQLPPLNPAAMSAPQITPPTLPQAPQESRPSIYQNLARQLSPSTMVALNSPTNLWRPIWGRTFS